MKKRSKVTAVLLSLALLICALPTTVVKADSTGNSDDTSVEVSPYISLGADLNAQQKDIVLALLGVTEADLDNYEVLQVTNKDEHEYLDDYLSASVIGTKALSSVRIEKGEEGKGIHVETKNITYCTSGMYTNALITAGITDADVIVSGGRGMGSAENFNLIRELAQLLGAAVGASRVVVDAEWADQKCLIGQTGKIVQPKLYIACGISGALQHMVGVEKAECIVAINRDPSAPIFEYADYAIVGDAVKIVSALIEQIKQENQA